MFGRGRVLNKSKGTPSEADRIVVAGSVDITGATLATCRRRPAQSLQNGLEHRHADQVAIADIDSAKQHHVDRLAIRWQLQPSPQFQPGNQDGRVPPRKYQ